jgi:hypothetical protein
MTREEKLKAGMSIYDIERHDRAQKVYDFAFKLISTEMMPNAADYVQREFTRKLLLEAAGAQNTSF